MPTENLIASFAAKIEIAPVTAGVPGTYFVLSGFWTLKRTNKTVDYSNPKDGRFRLPTLSDASGSFHGFYDAGNPPEGVCKEGVLYSANVYTNGTLKYGDIRLYIENLDIKPGQKVEDEFNVDFDWVLQTGTIAAPA
jgi:hypothetical protein